MSLAHLFQMSYPVTGIYIEALLCMRLKHVWTLSSILAQWLSPLHKLSCFIVIIIIISVIGTISLEPQKGTVHHTRPLIF